MHVYKISRMHWSVLDRARRVLRLFCRLFLLNPGSHHHLIARMRPIASLLTRSTRWHGRLTVALSPRPVAVARTILCRYGKLRQDRLPLPTMILRTGRARWPGLLMASTWQPDRGARYCCGMLPGSARSLRIVVTIAGSDRWPGLLMASVSPLPAKIRQCRSGTRRKNVHLPHIAGIPIGWVS